MKALGLTFLFVLAAALVGCGQSEPADQPVPPTPTATKSTPGAGKGTQKGAVPDFSLDR